MEEHTQANLLHTNTESKESKETQENKTKRNKINKRNKRNKRNKDKQILAIYFSYGEECKRVELKDIEQLKG